MRQIKMGPNSFDDVPPQLHPHDGVKVRRAGEIALEPDEINFECVTGGIARSREDRREDLLDFYLHQAEINMGNLRARMDQETYNPKARALGDLIERYEQLLFTEGWHERKGEYLKRKRKSGVH